MSWGPLGLHCGEGVDRGGILGGASLAGGVVGPSERAAPAPVWFLWPSF